MQKQPPKCTCEVSGYTAQRLRGRNGQFTKTVVNTLFRTTNCKLHGGKKDE